MAKRWIGAALVCGWLATAAVAHAQGYGYGEPPAGVCSSCGMMSSPPMAGPMGPPSAPDGPPMGLPANVPNASTPPGCCPDPHSCCCPAAYISAEGLLWWFKPPRLSEPLVTNAAGTVLLSQDGLGNDPQAGGRLTFGFWLDSSHCLALESDGFLFEQQPSRFLAVSDGMGNPGFNLPFNNTTTGMPGAFVIASPGVSTGSVLVQTINRFWGAESNLVFNTPGCTCGCVNIGLSFFGGFRYLDFREQTDIDTSSTPVGGGITTLTNDSFQTRTQFYGGDLGARVGLNSGCWFFAGQAKIALGGEDESVNTLGTTSTTPPPVGVPGGLFAEASNSGRFNRSRLAYVPEAEARFGFNFSPNVSMWAAYSLLYWDRVLRSGQQIDTNIGTNAAGVTSPQVLFNENSFWAQGVSLGLEIIF